MDVITNYLLSENAVEVGLNLVGYLCGGLIWMLIFRKVNTHTAKETVAETRDNQQAVKVMTRPEPASNETADVRQGKRTSYVDLTPAPKRENKQAIDTETTNSKRRDRSEIIRIAREMLIEGKSKTNIKSALPISDGELAMLARRGN